MDHEYRDHIKQCLMESLSFQNVILIDFEENGPQAWSVEDDLTPK